MNKKEQPVFKKNSFLEKELAAKNRELEIEASLERVREKAMAMHASAGLKEVVQILFEELRHLDVNLQACLIATFDAVTSDQRSWIIHGKTNEPYSFLIPYNEQPFYQEMLKAWKEKNVNWSYMLEGEAKTNWENFLFTDTEFKLLPKEVKEEMGKPEKVFFAASYYQYGAIQASSPELLSKASIDILRRFSKVFDSCYTRFLDLQKAEAQAREAEIELALERVRARTMAMRHSEELQEVVHTVLERLKELNVEFYTAIIILFTEGSKDIIWWLENKEKQQYSKILIPYANIAYWKDLSTVRENGINHFTKSYFSKEKDELYHHLFNHTDFKYVPEKQKQFLLEAKSATFSVAIAKNSGIHLTRYSEKAFSENDNDILRRFANVFEQSYTRFLDLQKAEAQAREAQIEAGLERVRSRAMAMQSSEELAPLIGTVFTELTRLDLALTRCVIWIFDAETNGATWWMANSEDAQNPINCDLPYNAYEPYLVFLEQWEKRANKFQYELSGAIKKEWDDYLFSKTGLSRLPRVVIEGMKAPECVFLTASFNNFGAMNAATLAPLSDQHLDVLLRFARVFDLTYTRFNDLKQAEAQAREAQMEAALERVRAKAMAMHNSNDVSVAASMVFTELRKLGIDPIRCGVGLLNKESRKAQLYSATSTCAGDSLSLVGWVILSGHPVLENIYDTWLKKEDYYPELTGTELKSYYENLLAGLSLPIVSNPETGEKQYGHFFSFSVGCLYAWSDRHFNDSEIKILKRFAAIIDLTFRRYLDLQKAEANAKDAVKQSALDRIRADIASMRTISDLDRITPLIWNELIILGVPFIRCGVFIMDDEQQQIHTFLSTPEGKGIAAFHLPYNTPGNIAHVITHWQKKEIYTDHWDEEAFKEFADNLVQQGAMKSSEQYLSTMPAGGFNLHFVPFQQGMLYVGNIAPLDEEEIDLLQSIADAFSTAYARYEDFNKLEAAKKQVDKTLTELRQTQQQLVQSEKMASLGELTAGIAHEIQNPLNFVNNFSDVNSELIAEMETELQNGNVEEAIAIANDIKENEQKINHHGKRADAIVKGMLQHSRQSSGQREPTDINALADEYLRLSYHGMRAKDKSFNAKIETDFDKSLSADKAGIGKINIVSQDIGRVLLNLFNNAFYAVSERSRSEVNERLRQGQPDSYYEPAVSVSTKKIDNKVEIKVKDNGNGIPKNVIDKIFQPFFTTKPTGSGTGLGLSLSYDIIKAHRGEIKVESKEGEGTEFIIQLPGND